MRCARRYAMLEVEFVALERLGELLRLTPEPQPLAAPPTPSSGALTFHDVTRGPPEISGDSAAQKTAIPIGLLRVFGERGVHQLHSGA